MSLSAGSAWFQHLTATIRIATLLLRLGNKFHFYAPSYESVSSYSAIAYLMKFKLEDRNVCERGWLIYLYVVEGKVDFTEIRMNLILEN